MKRVAFLAAILLFVLAGALMALRQRSPSSNHTIGVIQFVHHPLLDETSRGLMHELKRLGLDDHVRYTVEARVADKNAQLSAQIARQFLDQHAVLLVAIATPAAQAAVAQTTDTPVVFAAITDPVAAKLVDTLERPGRNVTGTTNRWPFEQQISLIQRILPNAHTVGALWNPGEVNSQAAMQAIRPILHRKGLGLVEASVAVTADVAQAAKTIAPKVDAFIVVPDNTILAATATMVQIARETRIPLLGGDLDTVRTGSLASYGYDYFDLGRVTAQMVKAILIDQARPATLAVRAPPEAKLILNTRMAEELGISIPTDLLASASEIVRN